MSRETTILLIILAALALIQVACVETPAVTQIAAASAASGEDVNSEQVDDVSLPSVIADTGSDTGIENDGLTYPIVDTNQDVCYDDSGVVACPAEGESFYGQDAQYSGNTPSYTNNGDGTITDNVTGLVWRQDTDTEGDGDMDAADKLSAAVAGEYCESLSYAGYDDWTLPTIKQLYSLINFSGIDPSGYEGIDTSGLVPFVNTNYFDFAYGDTDAGERIIDS